MLSCSLLKVRPILKEELRGQRDLSIARTRQSWDLNPGWWVSEPNPLILVGGGTISGLERLRVWAA